MQDGLHRSKQEAFRGGKKRKMKIAHTNSQERRQVEVLEVGETGDKDVKLGEVKMASKINIKKNTKILTRKTNYDQMDRRRKQERKKTR